MRDSAAEYFFSLVDEAASVILRDPLREVVERADYRIENEEEGTTNEKILDVFREKEEEVEPPRVEEPRRGPALDFLRLNDMLMDCHQCESWLGRTDAVTVGRGASKPLMLFVLDRVSPDGSFFTPQEKAFFEKWLTALHLDVRKECHFTSVIKCPGESQYIYQGCEDILKRQVEVLSPRVIVMLGSAGAFIATGDGDIFHSRGKVLKYCGVDTVVSFSPGQVLADYSNLRRPIWEDLKLAARIAGTDDRLK